MNANRAALSPNEPQSEKILNTVLKGLKARPKTLPPKLLYDRKGSELFDRICGLDEYYVTRTEQSILDRHVTEMAELIGSEALVYEFGSGASRKTRSLLERLNRPSGYVPIDISREFLEQAASDLATDFPKLAVFPICADFTQELNIPEPMVRRVKNRVVFFPGSTIGNFDPPEARAFLERTGNFLRSRSSKGGSGRLLIGIDLTKSVQVLEAAYNDSRGITAEFNLNLLTRLNREAEADFNPGTFRHRAYFNQERSRVEMHLISLASQTVHLRDECISFAAGETIHTESSYKYDPDRFERMAHQASLRTVKSWSDEKDYFRIFLLEPS